MNEKSRRVTVAILSALITRHADTHTARAFRGLLISCVNNVNNLFRHPGWYMPTW